MDRLLTVRELAERLNIAEGTAYRWLSQGRLLPCVRFSSRCVRFRESDVEKMLEQLGQASSRDRSMRKPT
jgi:excisionase family DNA binding protein